MSIIDLTSKTRDPGPLPAGRQCRFRYPDGSRCPTILHRNNSYSVCSLHGESKVVSLAGRIAPTTEELMEQRAA